MDYALFWFSSILLIVFTCPISGNPPGNVSSKRSAPKSGGELARTARLSFAKLVSCGLSWDAACFLDAGDDLVGITRAHLLDQADALSLTTARNNEDEESPQSVKKETVQTWTMVDKFITELIDMFKDGFSGWFKSSREGEEDDIQDDKQESDDDKKSGVARKFKEVARGKKKKKKILGLIKLVIIGLLIKAKLTFILKKLSALLQIKFFLVALAGLLLNAARFWLDLKKGHQPQKVIYYEHAQHQHHYDGHEDEWESSGPGHGGYWGRSYDIPAGDRTSSAHDLAYAKQKPTQEYEKENSGGLLSSWFSSS